MNKKTTKKSPVSNGMKIGIIGFGREGQSVLKFLRKHSTDGQGLSKESEIWILDENPKTKTPKGAKSQLGKNYLKNLDSFDIVFRSPGIPYLKPEFVRARKNGVKFSSATKLFFEHCPGKIIGITGTKGKGTTTTLLYQILKAAKKDVFLVGNIGTKDWLNLLPKISKKSLVVFELSSFQLQDLAQSPHIAAILDIDTDHLDHHKNRNEYVKSKSSIARYQTKTDKVFYWPGGDAEKIAKLSQGQKIKLSTKNFKLFTKDDLYLPAPHIFQNAITAARIAQELKISQSKIKEAVQKFRGLEYRLQLVANKRGVIYYNDSAATNPHATIAAIKSFNQPLILIAGGKSKGTSFKDLGDAIDSSLAQLVVLIGQNKKEIDHAITNTPTIFAQDLKEALKIASLTANRGEAILFSPASASFDMFKSYTDRGQTFTKLVKKLK